MHILARRLERLDVTVNSGEVVVLLLFVPLDDIHIAIFQIDEVLPQKLVILVDFIASRLIILGAQQVICLVAILVDQPASVVYVLLDRLQIGVLAVILVVMELQGDDSSLINVHGIFALSDGVGYINFRPLLQRLQLRREVDALLCVILEFLVRPFLLGCDRSDHQVSLCSSRLLVVIVFIPAGFVLEA